jgi:hypothetical protein
VGDGSPECHSTARRLMVCMTPRRWRSMRQTRRTPRKCWRAVGRSTTPANTVIRNIGIRTGPTHTANRGTQGRGHDSWRQPISRSIRLPGSRELTRVSKWSANACLQPAARVHISKDLIARAKITAF